MVSDARRRAADHADGPQRDPQPTIALATEADAAAISAVRRAAAADLTARFGDGHWTGAASERGVLSEMKTAQLWLARRGAETVGTFSLSTRKPWAIDRSYFTDARRPLYLTGMAVHPAAQRRGVGRLCLERAASIARAWPADAVRLDAYDADAGAGAFYERCGFRCVARVVYREAPLAYYELML